MISIIILAFCLALVGAGEVSENPPDDILRNALYGSQAAVVMCHDSTCPHCREIYPYFKTRSRQFANECFKVDISSEWCADVDRVPCFSIWKGGKIIAKVIGSAKKEIENLFARHCRKAKC